MSDEFPRLGGGRCLDFIATLGRRHRTETLERLPDPTALGRWLGGAGLPVPEAIDEADMTALRELREALYRSVQARMRSETVGPAELEVVNAAAARPDLAPHLDTVGHVRLDTAPPTTAAVSSTLARDGIHVLTTTPADRLRECEHPDCSLVYLDNTQGRRRRWCSMQRCGNQMKVSDYRERRRERA